MSVLVVLNRNVERVIFQHRGSGEQNSGSKRRKPQFMDKNPNVRKMTSKNVRSLDFSRFFSKKFSKKA